MNEILEGTKDIGATIKGLGPEMAVICLCIVAGYLIKVIPFIPSRYIPIAVVLIGGAIYYAMTPMGMVNNEMRHPFVEPVVKGMLLGFMAWVAHNKFLKRFIDEQPEAQPAPAPVVHEPTP